MTLPMNGVSGELLCGMSAKFYRQIAVRVKGNFFDMRSPTLIVAT